MNVRDYRIVKVADGVYKLILYSYESEAELYQADLDNRESAFIVDIELYESESLAVFAGESWVS